MTSYGMRNYPKNFRGEEWFDLIGRPWEDRDPEDIGVNRDFWGRTTRLHRVSRAAPVLGDSILVRVGMNPPEDFARQNLTFGMRFFSWPGGPYLHRRHLNRANLWFITGDVRSLDKAEIASIGKVESEGRDDRGYSYP